MTRQEFEKMAGLEISPEEYKPIEAYYMSLPEKIDKQKFAKKWLAEGGIQNLFDKRAEGIFELKQRLKDVIKDLVEREEQLRDLFEIAKDKHNHVVNLEKKLAAISAMAAKEVAA